MPSPFNSVGFALENVEQFTDLAHEAAAKGNWVRAPHGEYVRFAPGAGAEIWAQLVDKTVLIDCNPHFAGRGRMTLGVTRAIPDQRHMLDGGLYGWTNPVAGTSETGDYPVFVDVPDFDVLLETVRPPVTVELQTALFASELRCFASMRDFDQDRDKLRLAPQSFIPSGLFYPGGKAKDPLQAEGIFTGSIEAAELRRNPSTGRQFYWILVHTFGAVLDVVADPLLVAEQPLVGGVAQGAGWLTGRVKGARPSEVSDRAEPSCDCG